MLVAGIEFLDKCPENCPEKGKPFDQGDLCTRCPIFNCTPFDYPDPDTNEMHTMCLVEPEDYRSDWAKAWKEWFNTGMKGLPELSLKRRAEDEDNA